MSSSELCVVCRSLKRMPARLRSVEQRGDAGALALRVVGVDQLAAVGRERQVMGGELGRDRRRACLCSCSVNCFLPSLRMSSALSSTRMISPLLITPIAVGHLLGFLDVVGGQDDGHAGGAQRAHHLPHVLAQLDVDAGGRLVEEQDLRLVRQRLGDQHPALHAAGQRHDLAVLAVPQGQVLEHLRDVVRDCAACRTARG